MSCQPGTGTPVRVLLSERLQAVTEALAAARRQEEVFGVVLAPALQALGAVAGAILLVDETATRLEMAARQGYDEGAQTLWQDGPLDGNVPAGDALKRREALFFEQQGDLTRTYPELEARTGGVAAVATAVLPMFLDDSPLGVIILDFKEPHQFTPEEERFLRTLAAQCAIALGRARLTTDLQRQVQERTRRIEGDARAQEAFVAFTEAVGTTTDVPALARQAIEVLGARFPGGNFSYFEYEPRSARWQARVWSDNHSGPQVTMITAGFPSDIPVFADVLHAGGPVFRDGWDAGREQIEHTEGFGSGATYPLVVGGEVRAVLSLGPKRQQQWTERDRAVFRAVGRSLNLALERAEHARQREEERAALDAFVAFSEAVGTETDVLALARQAVGVVRANLEQVSAVYYELEAGLWKARAWSEDVSPEVVAQMQAGIPQDAPDFLRAVQSGSGVFAEGWDAEANSLSDATMYGAAAFLPIFTGGTVHSLLAVGRRQARTWPERERAVVRAVARSLSLTLERTEQARQLRARKDAEERRAQALSAFAELSRDLVLETDPLVLIRRTQQIVLALLPPGFSGYFEPQDGLWRIESQVGQPNTPELQAALEAGLPFQAASNLLTPWRSGEPFYQDEYDPDLDHLTGSDEYPGASVTLPVSVGGQTRGILGFALYTQRRWSGEDRAVLETVGRQLTLALERAEQTRQREEERAALDAFAAFTEASAGTTDMHALARRAIDVLRTVLGEVSVAYYDLDGARWTGRVWSSDHTPELVATLRAGIPTTAPSYAEAVSSRDVLFVPGWEAGREGVAATEGYGAGAFYPCLVGDTPQGLLAMGTQRAQDWTPQERQVFRAVGRSLTLALERAEGARQLQAQNAELDARTRALEGFADLTRDLSVELDPSVLVQRAQEVVLSLLPPGYAAFWRLEGDRWQVTSLVGEVGSPELQATIDAGLPAGQTPTLDLPFQTREALFQDVYDQARDVAPELVRHLHTVATLPVLVGEEDAGIFNVVLFGLRSWSPADRAVLETTARSLGLALEGVRSVAQLAQRTRELERSNAELEQFAYIASHDLQAPIRAVTSFAGVIDRKYGSALDDRARLYLRQIMESGEHMKRLVDDLLTFSRVSTGQRDPWPVDAGAVFDAVASRLEAQVPGAEITREELPVVLADAQQLDQLLQNLMGNGLKYQREDVAPRVEVTAQRDGELWRFAVQDNGIGIEPQYFDRIFVIFQRLHGRETYEGTGIGLAVCKKIVERHGGRLWLESRPGQGSTFFFTLPVA